MQDMMKMYAMGGMDMSMFGSASETLVLNANNDLVQYILNNKDGENVDIEIKGRHDPIIAPRAVVVVEAMTAMTILDLVLTGLGSRLDNLEKLV